MKFKVAVVQFKIKQFDPEDNLSRAQEYIRQAKSRKADIIVFPEDFLTGPLKKQKELIDYNKKYIGKFQELAKEFNINIVPGSIIEGNQKGVFNTTYYIDSKGNIKAEYQKINLWHPEKSYINPGNNIAVFNTKFGKIGLIICWDLFFPEIFRKMLHLGVKIVICPSYWTYEDASIGMKHDKNAEVNLVNSLSIARSFENEIIFIYCNAVGNCTFPYAQAKIMGRSQITVPFKGVLKRLDHDQEEMFIQEIDTSILKDAERAYKTRKDLKNRILC